MKQFLPARLSLFFLLGLTVFSCVKKTESFDSEPLSNYLPLTIGKYITYRLDSTVFTNFGRSTEVHKYQVKHVIDALLTDNLGRPAYRVYRYLRDTAGIQPWQPSGSYFITPTADNIEVIEDNLRFIKLHLPIRDGFSWKGNRYLPTDPYDAINHLNSYDNYLDAWDFYYNGPTVDSVVFQGKTYKNVLTVEEDDESLNVPITDPNSYASRLRAVEKYSKNIGLVYREYELWEYQPNTGNAGGPYKVGFAIKEWMIDHN